MEICTQLLKVVTESLWKVSLGKKVRKFRNMAIGDMEYIYRPLLRVKILNSL